MGSPGGRRREWLLALAVAGTAVASRELQFSDVRYDRFHIPAFDGHVYVAMAEEPRFFTVAPWGYRVLLPWLLSVLPLPSPVPAFFWSTVLGLTGAGFLLYLYLRRLGNGVLPALLGVAVFGASAPVGQVVRYQFLVEPLTLALEVAFLLSLQGGVGTAGLALLALLGALSKEYFLLLLPLVYLVRRGRDGERRALGQALAVSIPCLLATWLLRSWWTPHITPPLPAFSQGTLRVAFTRFAETYAGWGPATLLHGITPLAFLGAWRARGRPLALPAAYLALATLVSPFLNPVAFFAADIRRLLVYALPALLPLALVALDPLWPRRPDAVGDRAPLRPRPRLAAAALLGLLALPLLVVDRYRRIDLQGSSDALRVLAVCRETLRTARELEAEGRFVFDAEAGRFSQGVTRRGSLVDLRRVRWFLGQDWGLRASREPGDAVMKGREATLIVPCLRPRELEVALTLRSGAPTTLDLGLNGRPLGQLEVGPEARTHTLRLPADRLFRGDNRLTLERADGGGEGVRLSMFSVRPRGAGS